MEPARDFYISFTVALFGKLFLFSNPLWVGGGGGGYFFYKTRPHFYLFNSVLL
jgi:hypothetical protein